ncbi:Dynamin-like GTPase that mediates homotypic ER fusion, partial [Entomortierella lignicola]
TIALIPLYAKINNIDPATGTKFTLESSDDFDFDQSLIVLSESRQQELTTQLKRKVDATYIEAKRSIVATQAKIPTWVGVAILILGWNEFMSILTNPLYLSMTVMVGIPLIALWYLNMLGMVQTVGLKIYDQAMFIGKEKLREISQQPQPIALQNRTRHEDDDDDDSTLYRRSSARLSSQDEEGIELNAFKNKKF